MLNVKKSSRWWEESFPLFDLPAYATHTDPFVAKWMGKNFDVNDQYNISCQIWDDDILTTEHIGTVYYGEGLFVDGKGKTIPEWRTRTSIFEMAAAQNPNPEAVKILIDAGGRVKDTDVFMLAVKYNTPEIVELLIKNGADVNRRAASNKKFPEGILPSQVALERGDGKVFEVLARAGAYFDKTRLEDIIPEDKRVSFINDLSPEMREELCFPKEGVTDSSNLGREPNAGLYLSKFAQPQKATEPVQKTGKER